MLDYILIIKIAIYSIILIIYLFFNRDLFSFDAFFFSSNNKKTEKPLFKFRKKILKDGIRLSIMIGLLLIGMKLFVCQTFSWLWMLIIELFCFFLYVIIPFAAKIILVYLTKKIKKIKK